jgi:hypothetical protein
VTLSAAILAVILSVPNPWCADACDVWSLELATAYETAGEVRDVDPWLLAAISYLECSFDPTKNGKLGHGLMGLNPRSKWGGIAETVCDADPGGCLLAHVSIAVWYLDREKRRCGGWEGAIRSYGTGKCNTEAGRRYEKRLNWTFYKLSKLREGV